MKKRDSEIVYPLLFEPVYRKAMWGGEKLKTYFNRRLPDTKVPFSESWEITDRDDAMSLVENGPLKKHSLRELVQKYRLDIVGEKLATDRFPVMIRFVDAKDRLSLQVHPDTKAAQELSGAEPKDEMWYVIDADDTAQITAGVKDLFSQEDFTVACQSARIEKHLVTTKSFPGDSYYISAGTVHAIGAGNLILEICQNSDTTYRISDWGRLDQYGKPRMLHVKESLQCLKFSQECSPKISKQFEQIEGNKKRALVDRGEYFKVDEIRLKNPWFDETDGTTFHILTTIDGSIKINNMEVGMGRSCLVPATYGPYVIEIEGGAETTLVKAYV